MMDMKNCGHINSIGPVSLVGEIVSEAVARESA